MLVKEYFLLIKKFVNGSLSPQNFERVYLKKFKNEERHMSQEVFGILNYLFTSCDAYCSDPQLRGERDIDEKELLNDAKKAMEDLENIMSKKI